VLEEAFEVIFPSGKGEAHYLIFSRSLQVMSRTLRRDMYSVVAAGFPIDQVKEPEPDPLAAVWYLCIYWVDLCVILAGNLDMTTTSEMAAPSTTS
jgi:hypothetical protein